MIEVSVFLEDETEVHIEESTAATVEVNNECVIVGDYESFEGDYTVIPKATEQLLDTKNKHMKDNVTVEGIPYFEVSNDSGGYTAIIG